MDTIRHGTLISVVQEDRVPGVADFAAIRSLGELSVLYKNAWLGSVLDAKQLVTYFHPIVYANSPERVYANECLIRGKTESGEIIPPFKLFGSATDAGMLQKLDQSARACSLRTIHQHGQGNLYFVNFNPVSIYDPKTCLRDTFAIIRELGLSPAQIVFEVVESEQIASPERLVEILTEYRKNDFLVALDDIGSGYSSLNLLHQITPDYVKLDMALIRNVHRDPMKAIIAQKIVEIAKSAQILVVAEGVECAEEMQWVVDQGIDFVQGFYIAKPDPIPKTEITL